MKLVNEYNEQTIMKLKTGHIAFLAAGIILGLAACADDKDQKEHPGQGRFVASVGEMPAALQQVFRLYPDGASPLDLQQKDGKWDVDEWLPAGSYDMAVAGFDASEVELSGGNTIGETNLQVRQTGDAGLLPSLTQPVLLATALDCSIEEGKTCTLDFQPEDLRRVLLLTVDAGAGFPDAKLSGTLSGIARSVRLATSQPAEGAGIALPFTSLGGGRYKATAGILGVAPGEGGEGGNKLSLTLVTPTGEQYGMEEDLTEALAEALQAGGDTLAVETSATPSVPIRLYTGIRTRTLVDAFDETPVAVAAGTASGQYTESWQGTASGDEIVLTPQRYYPADGSTLYLRGYYPVAPLQNGAVQYTLTGKEDLMLSVEQDGSLGKHFDAVTTPLTYSHLLSQLNFTLKLKNAPSGYKIRSVTLDGLASTAVVNLTTGVIEPSGNAGPVIVYADDGTGGFPIVNGVATLPGYVLVQPEATLTLDLVLAVDGNPAHDLVFNDLPVRFDGSSEGGNAYDITIDFEVAPPPPDPPTPVDPDDPAGPDNPGGDTPPPGNINITVTATVTDWKTGNSGGAELKSSISLKRNND